MTLPDQVPAPVANGSNFTPLSIRLLLVLIVIMGAYLRVAGTFDAYITHPVFSDARDYWVYAINLSELGIFSQEMPGIGEAEEPSPDAVRAPGYPAVMALLMRFVPEQYWYQAIMWLQVGLGIGVIILTFRLFGCLLPPLWALAPAALVAVSPHLITLGTYLLSEVLFTFALLVVFLFIGRHIERPSVGTAFFTGTLMGLTTLIRAGLQYFSIPLALLFTANAPRANRVRTGAVFMLGFIIIIGAWGVRNLSVIQKWSDPTLQINFLHHGIYPGFMYRNDPRTLARPYRFDPTSPQISHSTGTILKEIWRRFLNEPARHLTWFLLVKPLSFWSWDFIQGSKSIFIYPVHYSPYDDQRIFIFSRDIMRVLHWPLVVLMLFGSVLAWSPGTRRLATARQVLLARAVSLLLLYYTAIHIVGAPFPRYAVPLRPFLYGMAVVACFWVYRRLTTRAG